MSLRDEAMLMLEKRGAVLETARKVSEILQKADIRGAIIGGVAVVLHGHIRTTKDVDVWIQGPLTEMRSRLESAGATFNRQKKEFLLDGVPIHLVDENMVQPAPKRLKTIEDITTITLPDLINIKLRSGLSRMTRAQDLADVIGLIQHHNLSAAFVSKIDKSLRTDFRKLVATVRRER